MRRANQTNLPFPHGWGGRREGAGRPKLAGSGVAHRSREKLSARHPVHVTLRVREGIPSLRNVRLVREMERSFRRACDQGRFRVVHYSLQGNHAHLIVEAKDAEALGRGMMSTASRLARAVNRVFSRKGRVLADRYHARVLRTPLEVRNALAYVLLNGRRHAGRKAKKVGALDRASSGRWFDGWGSKIEAPGDAPAVARARTWLILKGWRRHGLIGLDEIPARS